MTTTDENMKTKKQTVYELNNEDIDKAICAFLKVRKSKNVDIKHCVFDEAPVIQEDLKVIVVVTDEVDNDENDC